MNKLRLHIDLAAYALTLFGLIAVSDAKAAQTLMAGVLALGFASGMFLTNLLYNVPESFKKDHDAPREK